MVPVCRSQELLTLVDEPCPARLCYCAHAVLTQKMAAITSSSET